LPLEAEASRGEHSEETPLASPQRLQLRLFGPFALLRAGTPLPSPRTRKGYWLLALLLLRTGQSIDRAWLAATLWPDSSDSQARDNLHTSLKDLRHLLGPDASRLIAPTRSSLSFDTTDSECDLLTFDAAIAKGDATSLEQALALYGGQLLEGCDADWVFVERKMRAQAYLSALETLSQSALAASVRPVNGWSRVGTSTWI
jgi:DNA-binding SARP family transcriptional activator